MTDKKKKPLHRDTHEGGWINIDLERVEQLAAICGSYEEIAHNLGINSKTLYNRKREFSEFAEAIERGKAKANAFVAGKLMECVKANDMKAIAFYLKCRAGWKETVVNEITGGNNAVKVELKDMTEAEIDAKMKERKIRKQYEE